MKTKPDTAVLILLGLKLDPLYPKLQPLSHLQIHCCAEGLDHD